MRLTNLIIQMDEFEILIVEDDPLFLITLEWALGKMGCAIMEVVDNADDALRVLRKGHPKGILMDISIKGGMDGLELARQIRREQTTPIVFLTAYEDLDLYRQTTLIPNSGYLVKPFDVGTLRQMMRKVMEI